MTLIITNCSKRKRISVDPTLHAGALEAGVSDTVAARWAERLEAAERTTAARELYAGRAFHEAATTAGALEARLSIVSAGLGLVDGDTAIPAYGLTTASRNPDSILDKTGETAPLWWRSIQSHSPFHSTSVEEEGGLILAALSSSYLAMIADEWTQWPDEQKARLRLFTKEVPEDLDAGLRSAWMPYDDRLDAVGAGHAGTQSDFAQRALRHFAMKIRQSGSQSGDRSAVLDSLKGLKVREVPSRTRQSDDEILDVIRREWTNVGGRKGAMLRHFRDTLGLACEQSRFRELFNTVANEKAGVVQ